MSVFVSAAAIAGDDSASGAIDTLTDSSANELSALIQPPPAASNQQQLDSFASFNDALANEAFSEAEVIAKHMVEQVSVDAMDAGSTRARALHNLAIAQQFLGSHDSAIQNYTAAANIIAGQDGNVSPALILPLRGLAIAYLDTGHPDEAFAIFDRVQHVSDVNYGPHSLEQLPILNSKMQAFLGSNDQGSALDVLDRIHMLYSRNYAGKSQELLPALYQQAELYGALEMYADEFRAWQDILEIRRAHVEENDLTLIEPNLRMAEIQIRKLRSIGYRAVTTSAAEKHLKRALWIAENSPEANRDVRKDCLLSIADFYTLFDMKGRARRYYGAAWDLLSSTEMSLVDRAENFSEPVPLARPRIDPYANFEYNPNRDKIDPDDYLDGEITVAFTVDDHGRTRDLRIVAADPPDFSHMEKRVRNAVEEFVYRPRFADGKAATTTDQLHQARYFYLPSEYRASIEKSGRRLRPRPSKNQ